MMEINPTMPGSLGFPYLGETVKIFSNHEKYYYDQYLLHGEVFKTRLLGMDYTVLLSPDANQLVLKDLAHKFSSKQGWNYLEPLLGDGLLLQDGERHHTIRKLLYPVFHGSALNGLSNTIYQLFDASLKEWKTRKSFFIFEEFRSLTLKVACQVILGTTSAQETELIYNDLTDFVAGLKTILRFNIPFTKFKKAKLAQHHLKTKLSSIIAERRATQSKEQGLDILSLMLSAQDEKGYRLSDEDVESQILQLLFGGHETLAFLLTWLMFELYDNPVWIKKIRDETYSVGNSFDFANIIHQKLPFTDLVIKEIERLYPSVYFIPRGVLEDFVYKQYHISAGDYVMLSPFVSNRLPYIFKDPHEFNPMRFSSGVDESKVHPFALIPYGAGQHMCLGSELARLEIKIFLIMILQKFNFEVKPLPSSLKPILHPRKWHKQLRMTLWSI